MNEKEVTSTFLDVDEALYYWIDTEKTRMVLIDTLDDTSAKRLKNLRPIPTSYTMVADTDKMVSLFKTVRSDIISV